MMVNGASAFVAMAAATISEASALAGDGDARRDRQTILFSLVIAGLYSPLAMTRPSFRRTAAPRF
jgi:hypothetical protein